MDRAPFGLDQNRQYEVGRDGRARTDASAEAEHGSARHRLSLVLFGTGLLCVGAFAGLSLAALLSGARGWAAAFSLAMILASPLLLLGPVQDWWRHRRGQRRMHSERPWDDGYG